MDMRVKKVRADDRRAQLSASYFLKVMERTLREAMKNLFILGKSVREISHMPCFRKDLMASRLSTLSFMDNPLLVTFKCTPDCLIFK
jgi:hypothetical protein